MIYFVELHRGVIKPLILPHVLILMIVLQIAVQRMLALTGRQEPKDERDISIERIVYRNVYLVRLGPRLVHAAWHIGAFSAINRVIFFLFLGEITKLAPAPSARTSLSLSRTSPTASASPRQTSTPSKATSTPPSSSSPSHRRAFDVPLEKVFQYVQQKT